VAISQSIIYRLAKVHFSATHATRHERQAEPMNMQLMLVRRCDVGQALILVEDVKLGERTSMIRVVLSQKNAGSERFVAKLLANITMGSLGKCSGIQQMARGLRVRSNWERLHVPHPEFRKAATHVEVYRYNPEDSSPLV
jgi:hypothetical protein